MPTTFTVTIKASSITVYPGEAAIPLLKPLISLLTYEDEYTETTNVIGYIFDEEIDILYFHRGVDVKYLQRLLGRISVVYDNYDEYDNMSFDYEEIISPRNDEQVDVINFLTGTERHQSNITNNQLFLVLGTGKGKMEPYSRRIPALHPDGYITMGDLKINDYVFDRNGRPTKVRGVFDQGEQDIYKITFSDGRIALCGKEHLWCVCNNGDIVLETKMTSDLMEDYKLDTDNKSKECYRYSIPMCKQVQHMKQYTPIEPWVMGCFIGSGSCSRILSIYSHNDVIPNKIAKIFGFVWYRSATEGATHEFWYKNRKPVLTKDFFKEVPEMICLSDNNRFIPKLYLYNDINTRKELLRGIMDMCGEVRIENNTYTISCDSQSTLLLKHVLRLLYSFGYTGSISTYNNGRLPRLIFDVPFSLKHNMLFTQPDYHRIYEQVDDSHTTELFITNIEYSHKEKAKCIMVDNNENLYLTEDYIVTHNTYCTSTAVCESNIKTLIITHRDSLRNQWYNTLIKMMGMSRNDIYVIDTGEEMYDIANGNIELNHDVYLLTHHTFRAGIRRIGSIDKMRNFTKNLRIGMKIIDEAHLEFKDTLIMDFSFNVFKNIYLTATYGRSSKDENSIFKHVFANACNYKPKLLVDNNKTTPDKWVEYVTVEVNTNVPMNIYRYRVVGGRGMNPASYGKNVIQRDKKQIHMKACAEILRNIYNNDDKAKILVFMPLIELCSEAAHFFNMNLNYDDSFGLQLNIKTINSRNTKSENEYNKRADVIVTTIGSCGTGTDIPGITDIICCSPFVSQITAQQVFGRIRYCGKVCHYYDIYDSSVQMDRIWLKSRAKKMRAMALSSNSIVYTPDDDCTKENQ